MRLSVIAAVAANGVIGRGNELPWRLSADLKRFKRLTMGHHLLVGRKTWQSIGRPLPGRRMVVISRGEPELPDGVALAHGLDAAVELARRAGDEEAFVAGGAQIFREALESAHRLYLTRVRARVEGDVHFPELVAERWRAIYTRRHAADSKNDYPTTFVILERRAEAATGCGRKRLP